jgi:hypothetical protein
MKFQNALALNDCYFGAPTLPTRWGHIQMLGKSHGETIAAEAGSWASLMPEMPLDVMAHHGVLTSGDLPDPNNPIMYDRDGRVILDLIENSMEGHTPSSRPCWPRSASILICRRARSIWARESHRQHGASGRDHPLQPGPGTSALDLDCKADDLDTLYVVHANSLTITSSPMRCGSAIISWNGSGEPRDLERRLVVCSGPPGAHQCMDDPVLRIVQEMDRDYCVRWVNVPSQAPRPTISLSNSSRSEPTTQTRGALPAPLTPVLIRPPAENGDHS